MGTRVAAALLASAMGNTVTASGPRPRLWSSKNSAKEIGLDIPDKLLALADGVIE
jgi:hypothetical protein